MLSRSGARGVRRKERPNRAACVPYTVVHICHNGSSMAGIKNLNNILKNSILRILRGEIEVCFSRKRYGVLPLVGYRHTLL